MHVSKMVKDNWNLKNLWGLKGWNLWGSFILTGQDICHHADLLCDDFLSWNFKNRWKTSAVCLSEQSPFILLHTHNKAFNSVECYFLCVLLQHKAWWHFFLQMKALYSDFTAMTNTCAKPTYNFPWNWRTGSCCLLVTRLTLMETFARVA